MDDLDMKSLDVKLVVLGSRGDVLCNQCGEDIEAHHHAILGEDVGKTSIVIRYVGGMFSNTVSSTIGASFFTYKMTLEQYRIKLNVWDTAGQERFRSLTPNYYRRANAAMLVYDITSLESFYDIKNWVRELKKNVDTPVVLCLLGNKSDLEYSRKVSKENVAEFAASINAMFFETSAKQNRGIDDAFLEVSRQLIHLYESVPNSGLGSFITPEIPHILSLKEPFTLPDRKEPTQKQQSRNTSCAC